MYLRFRVFLLNLLCLANWPHGLQQVFLSLQLSSVEDTKWKLGVQAVLRGQQFPEDKVCQLVRFRVCSLAETAVETPMDSEHHVIQNTIRFI